MVSCRRGTTDRHCLCCGELFRSRNRLHRYCGKVACQRHRKQGWEKAKLISDSAYKANRCDAQQRWRERNLGYWRKYRANHPAYVARNREKQRTRNGVRGPVGQDASLQERPLVANTDASPCSQVVASIKSGTYRLIPFAGSMIANTDAAIVKLSLLSTSYVDCKDRT